MVGVYFQINDWVLSVDENKLYRQDREVCVEPRLINLLHFLAQHAGEVFCREELIQYVWDGAIVTDQVVTQSIFELRKLLRDGREENLNYVVTVPKRGYKLVADVERLPAEAFHHRRVQEPVAELVTPPEIEMQAVAAGSDITFPAGPLTRAVCQLSKDNQKKKRETTGQLNRWWLGLINLIWISILIIATGLFTYKQSEVKITQVIDTHLIEFKFQDDLHQDRLSDELADGIAQKLMSDITQVSNYRVMLHKTAFTSGIIPGKSVIVRVQNDGDSHFLEVEYRNNSSESVLFSRQYALTRSHLTSVMRQASVDLMHVLKVDNIEHKADVLNSGLPTDSKALELFVLANHYLNVSDVDQFRHGIELMEQIATIEPDNLYVQAELLIAYHVQHALDANQPLPQQRINTLSSELDAGSYRLAGNIQPRIFEALALHETVNGNQVAAKQYLQRALKRRDSVLSYVLKGKHNELAGDIDGASEAYSEAFYIDTSIETYMLCENLVFPSNLKAIDYAMYRSVHPSVVRVI